MKPLDQSYFNLDNRLQVCPMHDGSQEVRRIIGTSGRGQAKVNDLDR